MMVTQVGELVQLTKYCTRFTTREQDWFFESGFKVLQMRKKKTKLSFLVEGVAYSHTSNSLLGDYAGFNSGNGSGCIMNAVLEMS